jgi:hypothetical protein
MDDARFAKKMLEIPEEWRDETDTLDVPKLKERIAEEAKKREDNDVLWSQDPDVNSLAEQLKEAEAGYKEARDRCNLKIKYALKVLASKSE